MSNCVTGLGTREKEGADGAEVGKGRSTSRSVGLAHLVCPGCRHVTVGTQEEDLTDLTPAAGRTMPHMITRRRDARGVLGLDPGVRDRGVSASSVCDGGAVTGHV